MERVTVGKMRIGARAETADRTVIVGRALGKIPSVGRAAAGKATAEKIDSKAGSPL